MAEPTLPPARHEPRDVTFQQLLTGFVATLGVVLACMLLVMAIYPAILVDRRLPTPPPAYPEPRLQAAPASDLQRFVASELARLNSAGDGHIPIDEAMRRIAKQGIPDWPTQGKPAQ
jgi:hypothetical protein